jgi:hypothetical protein
MFVKADKCEAMGERYEDNKQNKPRAIIFRADEFVLALASFVKPIEGVLKKLKLCCKYPIFMKGRNARQRGAIIHKKFSRFKNPQIFCADASAFDGSVRQYMLNGVQSVYQRSFHDPLLDQLHAWRRTQYIRSSHGVSARIEARRCSGDADTSCGNCIIMAAITIASLKIMGITQFELINDGDDTVIITEGRAINREAFNRVMAKHGLKCDGQYVGNGMEATEFCRSRPVWVDGGWQLVNWPRRRLATFLASHRHYGSLKGGLRVMKAMAMSLAATDRGVPITSVIASRVCELLKDVQVGKSDLRDVSYSAYRLCGSWSNVSTLIRQNIDVTPETRLSYQLAFGISVSKQLELEKYYSQLDLECLDFTRAIWEPESTAYAGFDLRLNSPDIPDLVIDTTLMT